MSPAGARQSGRGRPSTPPKPLVGVLAQEGGEVVRLPDGVVAAATEASRPGGLIATRASSAIDAPRPPGGSALARTK